MNVKKAVIPAAGLGTRMLPVTKSIPKEMLPICDIPAIHYIVKEAVDSGITDILIITNRTKGAIEDYFDYTPEIEERLLRTGKTDEARMLHDIADMANFYFIRQKETHGLGHAIACAKNFVGDDAFAVLLGDDIMNSDIPVTAQLIEKANKFNSPTVGVQLVSDDRISKYCSLNVTSIEDKCFDVHTLIEKPTPEQIMSNYAILGRYVLTSDIFPILENTKPGFNGEIQLTDALNTLAHKRRMIAVDFDGVRFDTGNAEGYLESILEFSLKHPKTSDWLTNYIKEKAKIL